jgi:osmotically-inducible protein OsmY
MKTLTKTALVMALTLTGASATAWAQDDTQAMKSQSTSHSEDASSQMGDAAITAKVKAELLADSRTKAFDTNVETDNGVVTLMGTAPSAESKRAATEVARKVSGVRTVHNRLTVTADRTANPQTLSAKAQAGSEDGWLTTKVKSALVDDKRVSATDVHVTTEGSVVTLSGTVPSAEAKAAAVSRARQVKGVSSVNADQLNVGATN